MNRQEAVIERQHAEIESFPRDLEATQDSLNIWNEINLDSIDVVHVGDGVGTSISSVSRVTEAAVSHPPLAGSDPALVQPKERERRKEVRPIRRTPFNAS